MKTLKRKGKNCEYIKISFNDEAEYKAIIDCLNRSSILIGESFPEDTDGAHFELIKMLESTKMTYEDGTVSALIFFDFVEQLFWHCWDLSVLTCKHANLYQPEPSETITYPDTEKTVTETVAEQEIISQSVVEDDIDSTVEADETVDTIIDNNDIKIPQEPIDEEVVEETIEEPAIEEDIVDVENFSFYEPTMEEPIPEEPDIDDIIEEAPGIVEEVSKPVQKVIEEGMDAIIDLLAEETTPEEPIVEEPVIDETIIDGMVIEETSMCELDVDEAVLEEFASSEPEVDEEIDEEALRQAAFEAEAIRLDEEANARAAEIYAKMTRVDSEEKQPSKFMQRVNKFFKK